MSENQPTPGDQVETEIRREAVRQEMLRQGIFLTNALETRLTADPSIVDKLLAAFDRSETALMIKRTLEHIHGMPDENGLIEEVALATTLDHLKSAALVLADYAEELGHPAAEKVRQEWNNSAHRIIRTSIEVIGPPGTPVINLPAYKRSQ